MSRTSEANVAVPSARPIDEVVRRAQQGDVDAFEVIYRRTAPAIYKLCRRMLGDERDARDRVQDTFVRAWERLTSYRGQSSLETWLHRIKLPTLFLWGTADRILSEKYGRGYCGLIAGAKFEPIEKAGHFPHLEQPEQFASRVLAFADAAAPAAPRARRA